MIPINWGRGGVPGTNYVLKMKLKFVGRLPYEQCENILDPRMQDSPPSHEANR